MSTAAKWIFCALTLVACIAQVSTLIDNKIQPTEAVVLTSEEPLPTALSIHSIQTPDTLAFGSQVETFRFTLSSRSPYTLRYLTLRVESSGLQQEPLRQVQNWQLFAVQKGKVDYTKPIGHGEKWQENDLRLRLFTDENGPHQGQTGKQEFLLTGKILSDPASAEAAPALKITLPEDPKIDWAWLDAPLEGSWLSVTEWKGHQDLGP